MRMADCRRRWPVHWPPLTNSAIRNLKVSHLNPPALTAYTVAMAKNYWLVKSEPSAYSWAALLKDGKTVWSGVRNFQARNNLRAMRKGDFVAFYHSVTDKQVVGIAKVDKTAYADPTAKDGDWSCVDLVPFKTLKKPVSLDTIKADKILRDMPLVRNSRLSVTPVAQEQWERLIKLGGMSD